MIVDFSTDEIMQQASNEFNQIKGLLIANCKPYNAEDCFPVFCDILKALNDVVKPNLN